VGDAGGVPITLGSEATRSMVRTPPGAPARCACAGAIDTAPATTIESAQAIRMATITID
jgi:hypothetical protein